MEPPKEIAPLATLVSTVQLPSSVAGDAVVIVKAFDVILALMLTALAVALLRK
jgi:hypothetical protein